MSMLRLCKVLAVLGTLHLCSDSAIATISREGLSAPYPPLWNEAITLEQLPHTAEGKAILDPWQYLQRLGALKSLLELTQKQLPCLYPGGMEQNILWGLPMQFGWQYSSGRLFNNDTSTLSPYSWWADMNYQLMIIPLLGASAADLNGLPELVVKKPQIMANRFCTNTTPSASPACMSFTSALGNWSNFFKGLAIHEENCVQNGRSDAFDALVGSLWAAHTNSLTEGIKVYADQLVHLSEPESKFGTSWANLVDFIAEAHFVTDMNGTYAQQQYLPFRILHAGDVPGHISDLPDLTNRAIVMIEALDSINIKLKNGVLDLWKRAMCSKKGRAEGRKLINECIQDPEALIPGIFAIIADDFYPCD